MSQAAAASLPSWTPTTSPRAATSSRPEAGAGAPAGTSAPRPPCWPSALSAAWLWRATAARRAVRPSRLPPPAWPARQACRIRQSHSPRQAQQTRQARLALPARPPCSARFSARPAPALPRHRRPASRRARRAAVAWRSGGCEPPGGTTRHGLSGAIAAGSSGAGSGSGCSAACTFTFRTAAGTRTVAYERGTVVSDGGSSVVVRAADGTAQTWRLVSDTVIRRDGSRVGASALAAGQSVFVAGPVVSGVRDVRLAVIRPAAAGHAAAGHAAAGHAAAGS
jgi:hypothetical protein